MDRNLRFRISGLVFFIIFSLNLAFSDSGAKFLQDLMDTQTETSPSQIIIPATSAAILFFASDTTGYFFSSIFLFIFNRIAGGYNGIFSLRLGYSNLKNAILDIYKADKSRLPQGYSHQEFESRWKKYNTEQFLIYFFWHRPEPHKDLSDWVERRYSAYFIFGSSLVASILAVSLSLSIIAKYHLGLTSANCIVILVTALTLFALAWNGQNALNDALAITDLHIAGMVNPKIKKIMRQYSSSRDIQPTKRQDNSAIKSKKKNNNAA